jgi:PhnB protein
MPTKKKTAKPASRKRSPRARTPRRPAVKRTAPRSTTPRATVRAVTPSSGIAPGMQAINTFLAVANVRASMTFLERALGFQPGVVLLDTEGQPRYAEMQREGAVVMLTRRGDATAPGGGAAALYTYVDDVDRALGGAREAGAGVTDPEDTAWGDRAAVVTDPDGYRWVLATFKKLVVFGTGGTGETGKTGG